MMLYLIVLDAVSLIFYRSLVMLTLTIPWSIIKDQPPFPPNLSLKDRFLQVLRWADVIVVSFIFYQNGAAN